MNNDDREHTAARFVLFCRNLAEHMRQANIARFKLATCDLLHEPCVGHRLALSGHFDHGGASLILRGVPDMLWEAVIEVVSLHAGMASFGAPRNSGSFVSASRIAP